MTDRTERFQDEIPGWDADWSKWQEKFRTYVNNVDSREFALLESVRLAPYVLPNVEVYTDGSDKKFRILSNAVFLSRTNNTTITVSLPSDLVLIPGAIIGAVITPGGVGPQSTEFELFPNGSTIDPNLQVFGAVDSLYGIYWFNGSRTGLDTGASRLFSFASSGGSGTVSITGSDTGTDFLLNKLLEGNGIGFTVNNPGGNETLTIGFNGNADNIPDGVTNVTMTAVERTNLADAFLKSTDDSDDITEGSTKLLLTVSERADIADSFLKSSDTSDDIAQGTVNLFLTALERSKIADAFLKSTDDSDDITEGATNLFMTSAEKTNLSDAFLKSTDDIDDISDGTFFVKMTTGERTNLSNAFIRTVNDSDDINEGFTNLFLTVSERANLADAYLKSVDDATDIQMEIGNHDVQHLLDDLIGRGTIEGFGFTDNGGGSGTVATGDVYIHTTSSKGSTGGVFTIPGASFTFTDGYNNYIYAEYNGGSPRLQNTINPSAIRYVEDKIIVQIVRRDGTTLRRIPFESGWQSLHTVLSRRFFEIAEGEGELYASRLKGDIISTLGTRNPTISAGVYGAGTNRIESPLIDCTAGGTFTSFYGDTSSGWTYVTGQTQLNNTQYYNGAGGLASLNTSRYSVRWVWRLFSVTELYIQISATNIVDQADAIDTPAPSDLPPLVAQFGELVGRYIVQQGSNTVLSLPRWESTLSSSGVVTHEGTVDKNSEPEYQHVNSTPSGTETGTIVTDVDFINIGDEFKADPAHMEVVKTGTVVTDANSGFISAGPKYVFYSDNASKWHVANANTCNVINTRSDGIFTPLLRSSFIDSNTVFAANGAQVKIISIPSLAELGFKLLTLAVPYKTHIDKNGTAYVLSGSTVYIWDDPTDLDTYTTKTFAGITDPTDFCVDPDGASGDGIVYIVDEIVTDTTIVVRSYNLNTTASILSSSNISCLNGYYAEIDLWGGYLMLRHRGGTGSGSAVNTFRETLVNKTTLAVHYQDTTDVGGIYSSFCCGFVYTRDTATYAIKKIAPAALEVTLPSRLRATDAKAFMFSDQDIKGVFSGYDFINAKLLSDSLARDRLGCEVISVVTTLPISPSTGDRYLISGGTEAYESYVVEYTEFDKWMRFPRVEGSYVVNGQYKYVWQSDRWIKKIDWTMTATVVGATNSDVMTLDVGDTTFPIMVENDLWDLHIELSAHVAPGASINQPYISRWHWNGVVSYGYDSGNYEPSINNSTTLTGHTFTADFTKDVIYDDPSITVVTATGVVQITVGVTSAPATGENFEFIARVTGTATTATQKPVA